MNTLNLQNLLPVAGANMREVMLGSMLQQDSVIDLLALPADSGHSPVIDLQALIAAFPVAATQELLQRSSGLPLDVAGKLVDVSNTDYHADETTATKSKLELILRSPMHYKHERENPRKETDAMAVGSALHAAVLEPFKFAASFVGYSGRRDLRIAEYKEFIENHPGVTVLPQKDYDLVLGMQNAIFSMTDYPMWDLLQIAEKEKTIEWVDEETGVKCKIRPDALTSAAIIDLKKTTDARAHRFFWSARDLGYDMQAAMYRIGVKETLGLDLPFLFLAVEEDAPHGVKVYEAPAQMIADGERRFRQALRIFKECHRTNHWPGYANTFEVLDWRPR